MKQGMILAGLIAVALLLSFQLFLNRGEELGAPITPNPPPGAQRSETGFAPVREAPLPPGIKGNISLEDQVEFAEMPPTRPFKLITKDMNARKKVSKPSKKQE